jgi:hypothetical protein
MSPAARAVGVWLALGAVLSACKATENAAARDPMRCERDPACARERSRYADCTRQCADNPECIDRCEQVQQQMDSLGHRQ